MLGCSGDVHAEAQEITVNVIAQRFRQWKLEGSSRLGVYGRNFHPPGSNPYQMLIDP
jgi:hypothetical protein